MKKSVFSMAILAAMLFGLVSGANAQKSEKLFNGKDLSNWNFVVDKNAVPAEQLEQRLGMGLYALRAADYQQGVVQHA